jgi:hypothetical protein
VNFRRALPLAAAGAVVIGLLVAAPAHAEGTSPIQVVHQQFTGGNAVAFVTDLPADFDQRIPDTAYFAIDLFAADNSDSPSGPFVSIGVRYMHTDNTQWGSHFADGNTRFVNRTIDRMRDATATVDGVPDFATLTSTQASLANSLTNAVTICRGTCAG